MGAFLKPETAEQAVRLGRKPGSVFLGGGARLGGRGGPDQTLISLEKLGLSFIRPEDSGLSLGATADFQSILDDDRVPPCLRSAAGLTASRTLRNMMTVGGEIALHPACSPVVAVLFCLGARIRLAGKRGLAGMDDLPKGAAGDLILSVLVPADGLGRPCGVRVLRRTSHAPSSLVAAASARDAASLSGLRIVIGDSAGGMGRLAEAERALEGMALPAKKDIEEAVSGRFSPAADVHASAEYKRYMAGVMIADILHALAAEEAGA